MLEKKQENKHDFDGSWAAIKRSNIARKTFSVGIFKWLPKAGGKGLKRSAVVYRVKGRASNAEAVYARAREVCRDLDLGRKLGKKSETVG